MMRLGEKLKTDQPPGAPHIIECYFEKAIRFQQDDAVARLLYAMFLARNQRPNEVDQQLTIVTKAAGDNALTHYNAGLVYFDAKLYDKALEQAHKAMAYGYTQTALRDQLQGVNRWTEPLPETKEAPAPASE
jgi:tetratricopeptide (TPR) repeat protein